jgi:hypothetical protein
MLCAKPSETSESRKLFGQLDLSPIILDFDVPWNITTLSQLILERISSSTGPRISFVGLFSSVNFARLLQGVISPAIVTSFRRLLFCASAIHIQQSEVAKYFAFTHQDLQHISYMSGSELLKALNFLLSPRGLSGFHKQCMQVLFLLIFGTILSVGYCKRLKDSPPFTNQYAVSRP